jgi:hypothetical protein
MLTPKFTEYDWYNFETIFSVLFIMLGFFQLNLHLHCFGSCGLFYTFGQYRFSSISFTDNISESANIKINVLKK